jgi:Zn-dependent protease
MHRAPSDAATDARVGLAGPVVGAAVAVAPYGLGAVTGSSLLRALAHAGAVMNLFNLTPLWSLDGARGFNLVVCRRLPRDGLYGSARSRSPADPNHQALTR